MFNLHMQNQNEKVVLKSELLANWAFFDVLILLDKSVFNNEIDFSSFR